MDSNCLHSDSMISLASWVMSSKLSFLLKISKTKMFCFWPSLWSFINQGIKFIIVDFSSALAIPCANMNENQFRFKHVLAPPRIKRFNVIPFGVNFLGLIRLRIESLRIRHSHSVGLCDLSWFDASLCWLDLLSLGCSFSFCCFGGMTW